MSALLEAWSERLAASPDGGEPAEWVRRIRARGAEALSSGGLPTRRVEAWKYTPLRLLEEHRPSLVDDAPTAIEREADAPAAADLGLTLRNGRLVTVAGTVPGGCRVEDLAGELRRDDAPHRALLESLAPRGPAEAFAALNDARLGRGLALALDDGADGGTWHTRWQADDDAEARFDNARVALTLGAGARLRLVFEHLRREHGALNLVVQADLAPGARLEIVEVSESGAEAALITRTVVRQHARSTFLHSALDLGGGLVRHDLGITLAEAEASADVGGAWLVDGRQHVDTHVAIEHAAPDCRSRQLYRGLAGGRARAVWNGRTEVAEGADGSDARQSNANLLLSRLAEIDAKPELEIHADEVSAAHGATVGQLDEEAVFYLRSRGLGERDARRLLVQAFCRPPVERLAEGPWRERLLQRLAERAGEVA